MTPVRCRSRKVGVSAFTLLETVLALSVFAIVVVPAIGLVALSYRNTSTELAAPNAVEIKTLLEMELGGATTTDPGAGMTNAQRYYKVTVSNPANYNYDTDDAYRVFLFNIIWPAYVEGSGGVFVNNESNAEGLRQLILPTVLRK